MNDLPLISDSTARRLSLAGLLLLLVSAAAIRSRHLDDPFWLDELHTAWVVHGDWSDLAPRAHAGNQPGGYFAVLWPLVQLFGNQEMVLRLPSLLSSLALVLLIPWLVFRVSGSWAGAGCAAVLITVDTSTTIFAVEARCYALVQLLVVVQFWTFLGRCGALAGPPAAWAGWRIGWLVSTWLLVSFHLTTLLVIAAEWLVWWLAARQQRLSWRAWLLDHVLVAVCLLPLLETLWLVVERRHQWAQFIPQPSIWALLTLLPILSTLAVPLVACLTLWRRQTASRSSCWPTKTCLPLQLTAATCLLPLLVAWLLAALDIARLWHLRYLISCSTLLPVLAGLLLSRLPQPRWRWLVTLATLFAVLGVDDRARRCWNIRGRQEYWPAAIRFLAEADGQRGLPVMLSAGLIEDKGLLAPRPPLPVEGITLQQFCLFPLHGPYQLHHEPATLVPLATDANQLPGRVRRVLRTSRAGWLFVRGRSRMARSWAQKLESAGFRVRVHEFGRVHLFLLQERGSPSESTPGR